MNIERLRQIQTDIIEESYNQTIYFNTCGTPACIAGHIYHRYINDLVADDGGEYLMDEDVDIEAADAVDISEYAAHNLFNGFPLGTYPEQQARVTPELAVKVIDILIDERVVDWEKAERILKREEL